MYLTKEKALEKLNITESELETFKITEHIKYSKKTDKYDISSVLQKRSFIIGLENKIPVEQKEMLKQLMKRYGSFERKLMKELQHGTIMSDTGIDRIHRQIGKSLGFTNVVSDTALSQAKGLLKSRDTWHSKSIEDLEAKVFEMKLDIDNREIRKKLKDQKPIPIKRIKKALFFTKNRLKKLKELHHPKIFIGKKLIKNIKNSEDQNEIQKLKEQYKKKRLYYSQYGTLQSKNSFAKIELDESGFYLKIFKEKIRIKVKSTYRETLTNSLIHHPNQTIKLFYSEKGKLSLSITYSYLKPVPTQSIFDKRTVGIDINPKGIDVCYVKSDGNPDNWKHYPIGDLLEKRKSQTLFYLSKIIDEIVQDAKDKDYHHFTIENLEFKRRRTKGKTKKERELNRLLSKFPYRVFSALFESKSARLGLTLRKVGPAYTSFIGRWKYAELNNMPISHNKNSKDYSAALVIGRRGLGFREKVRVVVKRKNNLYCMELSSLVSHSEKYLTKMATPFKIWNEVLKNQMVWRDAITSQEMIPIPNLL